MQIIGDDNISCDLPLQAQPGSRGDVTLARSMITILQISSRISQKIFAANAAGHKLSHVIETMAEINRDLQQWRSDLLSWDKDQKQMQATGYNSPSASKQRLRDPTMHRRYTDMTYYGTVIYLHSVLATPWLRSMFKEDQDSDAQRAVTEASSLSVAEASRSIINSLRHINIGATTPKW